ncbi:hypothetical protein [Propionivibrio sp.]|uniref:hypothetical protein n=1 Tax=Propionivibrio sp. TaxID=2212460 RepID=UPI0025F24DF1|nr:hypothetical protein [Propionivibrio sp.]MBK7357513.1 hypothetical protein [Propionivibrio sp.]
MRTLFKPVAGTVKVAIGAMEILNTPVVNWTVSTTTGQVAFAANKSRSITGITKAAAAASAVGSHLPSWSAGSVYFSGVLGMTQINGLRGQITAIGGTTITVAINSTAFSTWTSGGTAQTAATSREALTAQL